MNLFLVLATISCTVVAQRLVHIVTREGNKATRWDIFLCYTNLVVLTYLVCSLINLTHQ